MFRKRRQPAPFFRMPGAPYNPATGENALLQNYPSKGTVLALFQVVEEDTHDNYIVCRGYEADADPEFRYLHDPYTAPTTTPINVAKPYSVRGTNPYELGQVVVAARIKGKLGYNPGVAATTVGQPADLDEEISLLTDDDDVAISWLDIGTSPEIGDGVLFTDTPTFGVFAVEVSCAMGQVAGQLTGCTYGGVTGAGFSKLFTTTSLLTVILSLDVSWVAAGPMGGLSGTLLIFVKRWNSSNVLQETKQITHLTVNSVETQCEAVQWWFDMAAGDYVTVTYQSGGAYTGGWSIFQESLFVRSAARV